MDNVDLNNSPDLTMEEITKLLFNNEFESDVQFLVEGKTLFSHSWELSKRSKVFREQFRGNVIGDTKLIPITDTTYKVFYQFLHFIYTDACDLDVAMIPDMLKLAVRYKIVKLENKVLNSFRSYEITLMKTFSRNKIISSLTNLPKDLSLLEFSLENKYELNFNCTFNIIIRYLDKVVQTDTFLKMKSNVLEEILKSDHMPEKITEVKLFNNLVRWMNKSCELNGTPISERRSHFTHLLRLIRFPTMTVDEFNPCHKNHPDLFTNDDISTICKQIVLNGQSQTSGWPAQPRTRYVTLYDWKFPAYDQKWVTTFTVSADLILHGLRFGSDFLDKDIFEILISGTNLRTNLATKGLSFKFTAQQNILYIISLGETVKLKPNVNYTVEIKYRDTSEYVLCRKPNANLIVTGPSDLITFKEVSNNLFEIIFKLATK